MRGVSTKIVRGTKRVRGFPLFFGIRLYNPAEKKDNVFAGLFPLECVCGSAKRKWLLKNGYFVRRQSFVSYLGMFL